MAEAFLLEHLSKAMMPVTRAVVANQDSLKPFGDHLGHLFGSMPRGDLKATRHLVAEHHQPTFFAAHFPTGIIRVNDRRRHQVLLDFLCQFADSA